MGKGADEMNEKKEHIHNGGRRRPVMEDHDDSAAIQRDIEQTRREMTDTFNEIQHRLDAQHLIHHASDFMRDALHQSTPRIIEAVKHNPLPTSLIALGVGWILMKASTPSPQTYYAGYPSDLGADYESESMDDYSTGVYPVSSGSGSSGSMQGKTDRLKEKASDLAGKAKDKSSQLADQAREKTSQFASQAKEKTNQFASQAKEKTSQLASQFSDQARAGVSHLGQMTSNQAQRANRQFWDLLNDYPLAVGACALAVGAAIGFSIPRTEREDQLMGDTRDQLMDQAKSAGQETVEKVKNVAQTAQQSIMEEAERQDLTSSQS